VTTWQSWAAKSFAAAAAAAAADAAAAGIACDCAAKESTAVRTVAMRLEQASVNRRLERAEQALRRVSRPCPSHGRKSV